MTSTLTNALEVPLSERALDFHVAEFKERLGRAQALMREQKMDALLLTHVDNIFYFTGYRSWLRLSQHRPFVAVVPASGDPVLVLPSLEVGNAYLKSWLDDVRSWQATDDYVGMYLDVLRELGITNGKVGIEMGDDMWMGLATYQWEQLRTRATVRFVPCADVMWSVRAKKSPAEVANIRRAAEICDAAVFAAWDALKPGATERDIGLAIARTMLEEGADNPTFVIVKSGSGPHTASNKLSTDRVIEPGDVITLDIGCYYRGYASDMQRSASLGKPSAKFKKAQADALAMNLACLKEVRPGVPIKAVDDARVRFLEENDYPIPPYAGVGHNLGISFHELPRIGPEGEGDLSAGMVMCVEPSIKVTPWGGIAVEDMVVVTESGFDYLTTSPRELFVKE